MREERAPAGGLGGPQEPALEEAHSTSASFTDRNYNHLVPPECTGSENYSLLCAQKKNSHFGELIAKSLLQNRNTI